MCISSAPGSTTTQPQPRSGQTNRPQTELIVRPKANGSHTDAEVPPAVIKSALIELADKPLN
jgi:hypothetical protein